VSEDQRVQRRVVVEGMDGLHLRAASAIATVVRNAGIEITLTKGDQKVSGSEPLQILTLCAMEGDELILEGVGELAEKVLEDLVCLFRSKFDLSVVPAVTQQPPSQSGEQSA